MTELAWRHAVAPPPAVTFSIFVAIANVAVAVAVATVSFAAAFS